MKKKKLIIIIVSICVLLLAALLTFVIFNNNKKEVKEDKITKLTDKTSSITLFNNKGLDENIKLQVKQDKNEYESVKEKSDKFIAYDISLMKDNKKVNLNSKTDVSIKIPKDFNKDNLVVFYIKDNKIKEEYKVKVNKDMATFTTNHFSILHLLN